MSPAPLEVGRVLRPHGLRGEVVVELVSNRPERLAAGTVLSTDLGDIRVLASRPHQHRFIVAFDGVVDRRGADLLRGTVLRAEPLDDPDALWVHQLIGAHVVTPDGAAHGPVEAVQANPASDLLVLASGALVPLTFVVGWDDHGRLLVDPPPGLLDG